jgi:hypothetical protein
MTRRFDRWWIVAAALIAGCRPIAATSTTGPPPSPTEIAVPASPVESTSEPESPFVLEAGFQELTLADFAPFAAQPDTWTETDDGLQCSGKPKGYLYSKDSLQNFTWKLEYRFPRPTSLSDESTFKGNTGFLVYINGEPKIWPVCLEVQGKHVQMGAIKENGGAQAPEVADDESARQAARKPVGHWNALEIVSRDGALTALLNGQQVASSQPAFLSAGSIGIQAEDHPFAVRRMRIRVD